jgi:phosphoribosylformimino-5-aminoimidazole carboxamide ribotide isomerase
VQLIPVVDLMGGEVVHARGGERSAYRPLQSSRGGSRPAAVVEALLALHSFAALYIADLDAIQRRGDNLAVVRALRRRFPRLDLWIDAGFSDADAITDFRAHGLGRPVMGSETLAASDALVRAARLAGDLVLSLDFKGGAFLGPADLIERPALWPERVIVMSLERVGSGQGPDLARLAHLQADTPGKRFYAAGGVRHPADLEDLERLGVAGVLLATALHAGRLPPATLARYG